MLIPIWDQVKIVNLDTARLAACDLSKRLPMQCAVRLLILIAGRHDQRIDQRHTSRLEQIEAAARVLGRRLEMRVS